ncbi:hypothetical protein ACFY0F_06255 [Streptomyces sp. NPDC001544]|uniref:hypothetical protein n=1 Tax=Streptomyces sp. NPDC001544 TaxID=3364584 RepID=UPI0036916657
MKSPTPVDHTGTDTHDAEVRASHERSQAAVGEESGGVPPASGTPSCSRPRSRPPGNRSGRGRPYVLGEQGQLTQAPLDFLR